MAQQTANYGHHQWEPEDSFLRTDFNEDFRKIDGVLRTLRAETDQKGSIAWGTYQGKGTSQTITLGFRPKTVIVGSGYETTANRKGRSHSCIAIRQAQDPRARRPGGLVAYGAVC